MNYISEYDSPLWKITLASDGENLIGLWFNGQKYFGKTLGEDFIEKNLEIFSKTKNWLDIYFSGKIPDFTPKLKISGSKFQREVCETLLKIPYGKTKTYGEIAENISKKSTARAVGGAVAHNSILLIIPCHRVVGANGKLTGYSAGIDKKIKLLELEGVK